MKTLVITPIHGRKELTTAFLNHYKRLGLEVCAAYTNDEDKPDCHSVQVENSPLAVKAQKAVDLAREIGADRYLTVGSDDFISEKIFKYYTEFDFIGFSDMYFWDLHVNTAHYFAYRSDRRKRKPLLSETLGAGQMFSHKLMEKIDFKIFNQIGLPESLRTKGTFLDQIGEHKARLNGTYKRHFMNDKPLMMCPKITNCIHTMHGGLGKIAKRVKNNIFLDYFPEETLKEINAIPLNARTEAYKGITPSKFAPKNA